MKAVVLIASVLSLATGGAALAQTQIGPGIPNGLSGPGGTETFTPTPEVPNFSSPSYGVGTVGRTRPSVPNVPTATVQPRPRR